MTLGINDGIFIEQRSIPLDRLVVDVTPLSVFNAHVNEDTDPHGQRLIQTELQLGNVVLIGNGEALEIKNSALDEFRDIVIRGLTLINGTIDQYTLNELNLNDTFIHLNANFTGNPTEKCGLRVERGNDLDVDFFWNEPIDEWSLIFPNGDEFNILHSGSGAAIGDFVEIAGDTMTGNLIIDRSGTGPASLTLNGLNSSGIYTSHGGSQASIVNTSGALTIASSAGAISHVNPVLRVNGPGGYLQINPVGPGVLITTNTAYYTFDTNVIINAPLDMNTHKIQRVVDPTDPQDVVTLAYLQANYGTTTNFDTRYLRLGGQNSPTASINWGGNKIQNMAEPTLDTDAATKYYADHTTAYYAA